ncbi:YegP family protein [Terriglobus roseus]|uniref:DUF1508 domain-containing protein n=1 Tax=Terriglobus roseus TaxID=392734 RepID=A0A1G7QVF1_9BACT|nr:YegP family protein [Terriglobus roseus]SDG02511.1 hypothetical protein SAMN05444167_4018 [Terriglobus roseus]
MAGKFVLKPTSSGGYRFNLKAGNGETILTSQNYSSKEGAQHGIESVRENAPNDERYDRLTNKAGEPYFNLKAANGQIIGNSEGYSSTSARDHGIESVKTNAPAATVAEEN